MFKIIVLTLIALTSCATNTKNFTSKEQKIMSNISSSNIFLQGKLRGIQGKSLESLDLKTLRDKASKYNNDLITEYINILEKSKNVKLYPRKTSFVLCLKFENLSLCDLSSCVGIEQKNKNGQEIDNPEQISCKI